MKSMWKLESSSFSNSFGRTAKPAGSSFAAASSCCTIFSILVASSSCSAAAAALRLASSSLLSVSMVASMAGSKGGTLHLGEEARSEAIALGSRASAGGGMENMKARRLAAAMMKCMCNSSDGSKTTGAGSRLGGDQKGTPCEVVASGGKLWRSCTMRLVKYDSNLRRAHPTQSSHARALSSTITSRQPAAMPQCTRGSPRSLSRIVESDSLAARSAATHSPPLARNSATSDGVASKLPTNSEWARTRHWSMLCGKLCTAHCGASFSGGSREAP
mmetsp:Transcript_41847/g.104009  ORF Transcript_41847/g.104009 Transcript_41847/m.104009 type:complete len:274 (+) Transcript_41847:981-1802(+)